MVSMLGWPPSLFPSCSAASARSDASSTVPASKHFTKSRFRGRCLPRLCFHSTCKLRGRTSHVANAAQSHTQASATPLQHPPFNQQPAALTSLTSSSLNSRCGWREGDAKACGSSSRNHLHKGGWRAGLAARRRLGSRQDDGTSGRLICTGVISRSREHSRLQEEGEGRDLASPIHLSSSTSRCLLAPSDSMTLW